VARLDQYQYFVGRLASSPRAPVFLQLELRMRAVAAWLPKKNMFTFAASRISIIHFHSTSHAQSSPQRLWETALCFLEALAVWHISTITIFAAFLVLHFRTWLTLNHQPSVSLTQTTKISTDAQPSALGRHHKLQTQVDQPS
jgi:hypothetical protein